MAVTASLRGNAARGFKIFYTSVSLVPIASSLASRRYHRAVDTEDNHHRLFHRSRHRTPTRTRRPRRRASRVSRLPSLPEPYRLISARPRSIEPFDRPRATSVATSVVTSVRVPPRARRVRSFPRPRTRVSSHRRLPSSPPSRASPIAPSRARPRATVGRIHPSDSTGDAREDRRRPSRETTAGRIKNTPVPSIDRHARLPRPHRSTRRLRHHSSRARSIATTSARVEKTYRDGAKPLTAPNCARATPVAARRVVVAALAETTTRDGAAIVVIITATREGSREDVTSRDGLARARAR